MVTQVYSLNYASLRKSLNKEPDFDGINKPNSIYGFDQQLAASMKPMLVKEACSAIQVYASLNTKDFAKKHI